MPTYEFRCPNGHEFERFFRKISDAAAEELCPECGAVAARQLSAGAGLLFKGSGFYLTDYGKNAHRKTGQAGGSKSTEGKSDGGGGDTKGGEPKSGEPKSGEPKSGDSKSGDAKSGDARSGDAKSGDAKSGDAKGSSGSAKGGASTGGSGGDKS
jgi:putative FmdB family regulatory protein